MGIEIRELVKAKYGSVAMSGLSNDQTGVRKESEENDEAKNGCDLGALDVRCGEHLGAHRQGD